MVNSIHFICFQCSITLNEIKSIHFEHFLYMRDFIVMSEIENDQHWIETTRSCNGDKAVAES